MARKPVKPNKPGALKKVPAPIQPSKKAIPQPMPKELPPVREPKIMTSSPMVAPDRALDSKRSIGSGPSMKQPMSKTMPAPRNYGGITAQPMPAFPGDSKGGIKTLPIKPTDPKPKYVPLTPKDPSIQNMPYKPGEGGGGIKTMPYIPPKDGSGPKVEKMPFKPESPKTPGIKKPNKMERGKP
jgi:hypothetical protein